MLYDGRVFYTDQEVADKGISNPQDFGIYPVIEQLPNRNTHIEGLNVADIVLIAEKYYRSYTTYPYDVHTLRPMLSSRKEEMEKRFIVAFAEIDAKTRPMRGALLSVAAGTFPTQAYSADEPSKDLTPEQQQRVIDVGIMWELEEVAQVNRDMQAELLALEITEDMTLEQAQEITLRIANAQPWLPWRE